jgi:colanic acid/amylovoran biosynthesis glycosyltransferase
VKLLYITVSLPFGPGEAFFIPEIKGLLKHGCEIAIVPRSPKGAVVNGDAQGLQQISLRRPILSPGILAAAAFEVARHPLRCLRACGFLLNDCHPANLLKNILVFPKALWLGRWAREQGFEHIHAQWIASTATMALVAGEISGIPWSCTAHRGDIAMNNLLRLKLAKAAFVRFISESGLRMAEKLVGRPSPPAPLPERERGLVDYAPRPKRERGLVIHVGVEMPDGVARSAGGANPLQLLCPANLLPVKGHKYLLQAMALLKNRYVECTLLVAGRGELQDELEKMAADLSLGSMVRFLGQVPHDEILAMYRDGKIGMVVLPSVDLGDNLHEGIPVALVEAMAYGIPVVATETGGIPELLGGGAGMMVPPKDAPALAGALEALVRDPAMRERLARAGRTRAREGWALEKVVEQKILQIENCKFEVPSPGGRGDGRHYE